MKTKRQFIEERIYIENERVECSVKVIESAMEDYANYLIQKINKLLEYEEQ